MNLAITPTAKMCDVILCKAGIPALTDFYVWHVGSVQQLPCNNRPRPVIISTVLVSIPPQNHHGEAF